MAIPIQSAIIKRDKLAVEIYQLNRPDMSWEEAMNEANFWIDYLNSDFHHKK